MRYLPLALLVVLLVPALWWLERYSNRPDSGNGSSWTRGYRGAKDTTVYAYRRRTREIQQDNDARAAALMADVQENDTIIAHMKRDTETRQGG